MLVLFINKMKNFQLVIFVLLTIQCMVTFSTLLKSNLSKKSKFDPEAYTDPFLSGNVDVHQSVSDHIPLASRVKSSSSSSASSSSSTSAGQDKKEEKKEDKKEEKKDEKKEIKKPGGPKGLDDINEIPFIRPNQKYTNSTVVQIDPTLKFVYNVTLPTTFLRVDSNFPYNMNFKVIDSLTQIFNVDKDLARLKVTVKFPEVGDHKYRYNMVLMLFLDDKLIGETNQLHYSDNSNNQNSNSYNNYFYEPLDLKGIVYNVRAKTHKLSIGIRYLKMYNAVSPGNGDGVYLDTNVYARSYVTGYGITDVIDRKFPVGINFYMEGEVLKTFTYEDQ